MTEDRPEDSAEDPQEGAQRRIEALEEEVARLRSELQGREGPTETDERAVAEAIAEAEATPLSMKDREVAAVMPSKSRAIVIAVAIAVVALAGILFITCGLSTVIKPFSRKAARFISPWEPVEQQAPKQPDKPPPPNTNSKDDFPRAPGL